MNDSELLERHARGEMAAFGVLYRKYHRRLYGYCYRLLVDRDIAEDVVQSAFAKALESAGSLEKRESFRSWLFTVARNEVYAMFRRKRSNGTVALSDNVWNDETPHEQYVHHEISALVEEGLHRLKPEYREVLVLRQYEKMTYAQIASVTGDTISSVESRLYKARRALIKYLEPYVQERGSL